MKVSSCIATRTLQIVFIIDVLNINNMKFNIETWRSVLKPPYM